MAEKVLKTIIQFRRNTTDGWVEKKDYVPYAGEPCLDTDTGIVKYGDGTTSYENLEASGVSASHYEGVKAEGESDTDVITRVLTAGNIAPKKDDIFIVKALISGDKYSYTAFVFNGSMWVAMDGNYNAKNVIFDSDLMFTQAFGKYAPGSSGSVTVPAEAKSIYDMLMGAFSEEKNPSTTQPSISVSMPQAKAYEVGTSVTPSYTTSFNEGNYTYKPDSTGVKVSAWEVTDSKGVKKDTSSGSFDAIVVADNTSYNITAKATYGDGAIPKTNIGNDYPAGQIKGGTKTATSGSITGYRSFFYGVISTSTVDAPLTSDIVRSLTNGGAYNGGKTFTVNANASAKRIVVAVPSSSTRGGLKEVILTSAMNTPVTGSYVKNAKAVKVEGVNKATAVDYDVWVYEPAAIDAGEVHKITLA